MGGGGLGGPRNYLPVNYQYNNNNLSNNYNMPPSTPYGLPPGGRYGNQPYTTGRAMGKQG